MVAVKGAQGGRHPLRLALFGLSLALCVVSIYFMLDFQSSSEGKLSGELIIGQVDTINYQQKDAPILSFLFEYFGVLSYMLAFVIAYLGYYLLLKPFDIWHADFYKGSLRLLGFNLLFLGGAGLCSRFTELGATGAGGLLGDMLNMFCNSFLPNFLTYVLFAAVGLTGLAFFFGRNPFVFCERIGEVFFKVLPAKSPKPQDVQEQQQAELDAKAAAASEAEAAADPNAGIAAISAAASGMSALTMSDDVQAPSLKSMVDAKDEQQQQLDLEQALHNSSIGVPSNTGRASAAEVAMVAEGELSSQPQAFERSFADSNSAATATPNFFDMAVNGRAIPPQGQDMADSLYQNDNNFYDRASEPYAPQGNDHYAAQSTEPYADQEQASYPFGQSDLTQDGYVPEQDQYADGYPQEQASDDNYYPNYREPYGAKQAQEQQANSADSNAYGGDNNEQGLAPDSLSPVFYNNQDEDNPYPGTYGAAITNNQVRGNDDGPQYASTYAENLAAKQAAKNPESVVAEPEVEEEDDGVVHTIVQRTDPQVFQAQMQEAKAKREAEERAKREAEAAKATQEAQEAQETQVSQEGQVSQEAQDIQESSALEAKDLIDSNSDTTSDVSGDSPIYAGTYANSLERQGEPSDAPAYIRPGVYDQDVVDEEVDSNEEVILAEPNTHEIGVRLPMEQRPRTIIQDTRREFEEAQAVAAAKRAQEEALKAQVQEQEQEQEQAQAQELAQAQEYVPAQELSSAVDIPAAVSSDDAVSSEYADSPAKSVAKPASDSPIEASVGESVVEKLADSVVSTVADSSADIAKAAATVTATALGVGSASVAAASSLTESAASASATTEASVLDNAALSEAQAIVSEMDSMADHKPDNQDLLEAFTSIAAEIKDVADASEASSLEEEALARAMGKFSHDESTSTLISRSAMPEPSERALDNDDFDLSSNTSIIRSAAPVPKVEEEEDSFSRYALAHANERQESVEVNLFGSDNDNISARESSLYEPQHSYDFGDGQQAGSIRPAAQSLAQSVDDSYIGGAAEVLPRGYGQEGSQGLRTQNFSFAQMAKESDNVDLPHAMPKAEEGSSLFGGPKTDENIITFAPNASKSYEVDGLSSAFIPMGEADEHEKAVENGIVYEDDNELSTVEEALESVEQALDVADESSDIADNADLDIGSDVAAVDSVDIVDSAGRDDRDSVDSADGSKTSNSAASEHLISATVSADCADDFDSSDSAGSAGSADITDENSAESKDDDGADVSESDFLMDTGFDGDAFDKALMEDLDPNMDMGGMDVGQPNMYATMPQVQYVQLPNGQYVPVMQPNMAMPMAGMPPMPQMGQMGQMPQLMQMPNGQMVPMMPNMMYGMQQGQQAMPPMAMPNAMSGAGGEDPITQAAMAQSAMQAMQAAPAAVAPASGPDANATGGANAAGSSSVTSVTPTEESKDEATVGVNGVQGVGMPTAGNNFMGAHNSSSSNLPSYMASVDQGQMEPGVKGSAALCSVPRRSYDEWRPDLSLLARSNSHVDVSLDDLNKTAEHVNEVLRSFNIKATVADYLTGPVITRFDLDLAPGVKSSAISSIETELCRNLMVPNVRVVPIIEGSSYVGLEVPNPKRQFITLGDMAVSREFTESKASLPMCLGASVIGAPVVKDLAESPHLLVAGTTGSGKSAGLNTMLISLLLKRSPAELRLILVDPKQLEFSIYKDLPHLITPVITDVAEKTPIALSWCVDEMERRFKLMSLLGVRKLSEYNDYIKSEAAQGRSVPDPLWNTDMGPHPQALEPLPWIVVVIEEFADLMAQSGRKKDKEGSPEALIARLSAKSRAAGIHLVLVTQTPRAEVVTGMIKANFPSRIAFTVQNRTDSTIVLDEKGAESLLGNGDMLYKFTGAGTATRAHGAFTSNADVKAIVDAWRQYAGMPEYLEDVVAVHEEPEAEESDNKAKELDVKFDQAVQLVRDFMDSRNKPPTVTDLQTELGVGYPRAKKIYKQLTSEGIIV